MPRKRKPRTPTLVEARIKCRGFHCVVVCGGCGRALVEEIVHVIEGFGREDAAERIMIFPWGFTITGDPEAREVLLYPTKEHLAQQRLARETVRTHQPPDTVRRGAVGGFPDDPVKDARGRLRHGFFARLSDTEDGKPGLKSHGIDVHAWRRIEVVCPRCGDTNHVSYQP